MTDYSTLSNEQLNDLYCELVVAQDELALEALLDHILNLEGFVAESFALMQDLVGYSN